MNILEEIIAYKKIEVEKSKEKQPLDKLKNFVRAGLAPAPKGFYESLKDKITQKRIALITEIKKASPSKGIIRADFNHIEIA